MPYRSVTGQQLWHFCPDNISQVLNIVLGFKHVYIFFFNEKTKIYGVTIYLHNISAVLFFGLKTFLINNFIVSMTKFATYCSFYPSTAAKVIFLCLCPDLRRFQKLKTGCLQVRQVVLTSTEDRMPTGQTSRYWQALKTGCLQVGQRGTGRHWGEDAYRSDK
jgi:hypothetical protein